MLDYAHLQALLAVEREKSFEGAARALGVTSSAISQRIKLLEERIGAVALNRQTPVTTTEVGATLCRHAEKVILLPTGTAMREDEVREVSELVRFCVLNGRAIGGRLRQSAATESPVVA